MSSPTRYRTPMAPAAEVQSLISNLGWDESDQARLLAQDLGWGHLGGGGLCRGRVNPEKEHHLKLFT